VEGKTHGTHESARRSILLQTAGLLTSGLALSPGKASAETAEEDIPEQGMFMKAGKLGAILLLADVVTGVVLGKSALDIISKKSGASEGWKGKMADLILGQSAGSGSGGSESHSFPIQKSPGEWKSVLSADEFRILRLKGTERPMTGEYNKYYPKEGFFKCAACGNPLYSAASKFDSGCGWPAFDKCYQGSVTTEVDASMGMRRVEIMCSSCGGHLGHVFEGEGFTNTNERHCVNSVSVKYDPGSLDAAEQPVMSHK